MPADAHVRCGSVCTDALPCRKNSVKYTVNSEQGTVYIVQFTVNSVPCKLYTVRCTV